MATLQTELFREVLDLKEKDRAKLAGLLIESLDMKVEEGVEAAWISAVERRLEELEKGQVKAIPWEEVQKRLLEKLNARNDDPVSS